MTRRLFVYGTLMPDHEAWPIVEPYAESWTRTVVRGHLYDTGAGYPAAVFDTDDDAVIEGTAVVLHAEHTHDALAAFDHYEGAEYRRIVVNDDHGALYTYEWIAARDRLIELPSGSWTAPA